MLAVGTWKAVRACTLESGGRGDFSVEIKASDLGSEKDPRNGNGLQHDVMSDPRGLVNPIESLSLHLEAAPKTPSSQPFTVPGI